MQTYEQIMMRLRQGQYDPVYFLCGEEPYYIDCISDYIEQNALDEMSREFNQLIFYGKDLAGADIAPVISQARAMAMMGKQVIIVKEAQHIRKWESLGLYIQNPNPETILVICYKYGAPDKRQKTFKTIDKDVVFLQTKQLRDYEINKWILAYINEWNRDQRSKQKDDQVTIDEKVVQILADNLGSDLTKIVGALRKLVDGRPEGVHVIDAELVERNVGISKDFNVFELQKALIAGDVFKANQIVNYFAQSKDHPMVKELGVLYNFFANLMIYHYLPNKSDQVAAAALGVSPFFVKDYAAAARRFNQAKTFRIIGYFRDTDARSKGVNNPSAKEGDLWKELIYKILH